MLGLTLDAALMRSQVSPTSFGAEAQARKTWATTKDPKKAMQMFPGRCRVEKSLMRGVIHHGIGYQAFVSIPRNMRMLYLHAYQSYLWNVVTTKRLELHGLKPVVGDLVLDSDSETFHPDDEKKVIGTAQEAVLIMISDWSSHSHRSGFAKVHHPRYSFADARLFSNVSNQ